MFKKSFSAAASVLMTAAVLAQSAGPIPSRVVLGKAVNVQGLVTVSDQAGVSRVLANNDVVDRTRYVTSSSGSAMLRMDKGCDIELKPNQALTVEEEKSCDALWASIESLGNKAAGFLLAGGAGGAAAAGGASLIPFVVGGAVILLLGGGGVVPSPDGGGVIPVPPPIISPQ